MFTVGISRASHLLLVCTGTPVFDDLLALVDLAAALSLREGWARILVDCIGIRRTFTPNELVRIGVYAGKTLAGNHVAIVVPDEKRFDATRFAAASAGGKTRFFMNHLHAANWLMTAGEAPPVYKDCSAGAPTRSTRLLLAGSSPNLGLL